jgi:hypothetical protein
MNKALRPFSGWVRAMGWTTSASYAFCSSDNSNCAFLNPSSICREAMKRGR